MNNELRDKVARELWQTIFAHVRGRWSGTEKLAHNEIRELIAAALDEYAERLREQVQTEAGLTDALIIEDGEETA